MKKKAGKKGSASKKPAKKVPARKKPAKKAKASAGRGSQASRTTARSVSALWQAKWPEIVASAWADTPPGFRQRLLTDTRNVLREHGLPTVEGFNYRVAEGSERFEIVLPLPSAPTLQESSTTRGGPGSVQEGSRTAIYEVPRCGEHDGDFSI